MKIYSDKNAPSGDFPGSARCNFAKNCYKNRYIVKYKNRFVGMECDR